MRRQMRFQVHGKDEEVQEDEKVPEDAQVRGQVRSQMRAQGLATGEIWTAAIGVTPRRRLTAAVRVQKVYSDLATRQEHLLTRLLCGRVPRQWEHYPENDAVDAARGYQWFYHSHAPEDRPGGIEHGHIHLFARQSLWSSQTNTTREKEFRRLTCARLSRSKTRHLLSIGLNASGLPITLFTVNSWVTGDAMLSADLTLELLLAMRLRTRNPQMDTVIESVIALCSGQVHAVLTSRDQILAKRSRPGVLEDQELEILSETAIDLDAEIGSLVQVDPELRSRQVIRRK